MKFEASKYIKWFTHCLFKIKNWLISNLFTNTSFTTEKVSNSYQERLNILDSVMVRCSNISRKYAGIKSPTSKHYWASILFTQLCTRTLSLLITLLHSRWTTKDINHWDFTTAASLTRNIIECYLMFYYLCIDNVSEDEWRCRWHILNLHDCTSRKKLFEELNDNKNAQSFDMYIQEQREALLNNAYFSSLAAKIKTHFLKGDKAFLLNQDEIVTRMNIKKEELRFMYRFVSFQVHSLPASFYRMGEQDRSRGTYSEIEENYTQLCISWCTSFLVRAANEMEKLFS